MSTVADAPVHWDPYNQSYFADPYPAFARLREQAPVYYNEEYKFYAVSRYADVERLLIDRAHFSSAKGDILEMIQNNVPVEYGTFIHEDAPAHTVHRKVLTRVFTPKRMWALEPQVRAFCAKALDPLVAKGEFDFIEDLGMQMPMRVIGMMLGIPDADLAAVQERVDSNLRTEAGKPMDFEGREAVGSDFEEYIAWREKHPSDDLMTELLGVEFTDDKGVTRKLTKREILIFVSILAGAGNETTNRLIGWTGKILAEHPDQRRAIYEDRNLIPQAIEEILRFEPPGPSVARYVTQDTEFDGVKVPAGSAMVGLVAAANRDSRKFVNGDSFDIHRERVPHLTFGAGFHVCLGNALARVEGRVALDELLNRFPEWNVDLENGYLSSTSTVRGWETLPAYTPAMEGRRTFVPKPKEEPGAAPPIAGAEQWTLTLQTPMGPQEMVAQIIRDGDAIGGRIDSPMGSEQIADGKAAGDKLSWVMNVTKPMALKLRFDVTQTGDSMTGEVELGAFGKAALAGQRS